ncbi:MAG TPA: Wzz/FepE/Etk N-terminal domain-containing protein [Candidatus Acidoferrum sp.]|nr:Wzz/FepE/Etk N-terminal domain-containing protein [Candidatus Acidoferrum sp.]
MSPSESGSVWLFLELLAKQRRFIILFVVIITLLAAIVSFVLPKWYRAEALLLPPKDVSAALALDQMAKLNEVVSVTGGLNLPVMVTASDVYARMLRSHAVCDRVIAKFDLKNRYHAGSNFETYDALMKHARFRVTEEGLLSVSVEDREAQTAADMANAFVDEIESVNQEIITSRSTRNREFIEQRLTQVKGELDSSRAALAHFQETNRTVDFDEQTKLAIEQASALKVSLAQVDLELKLNEMSLGKDNPELTELKRRHEIIQQQLDRLEKGGVDTSYFSLPVASIPELRGRYELLYSRVRVNESLYNMLLEQLEQAKLQEKQDTPVLSVLDRASVPEIKSRPQRTLIVLGAFGISLLIAILLAALFEHLERLNQRSPEDFRRATYVLSTFFGWIPGVKRRLH